jgi:hypothetical protein
MVHADEKPPTANDDLYAAYDWRVYSDEAGQITEGAIGRAGWFDRAKQRVAEALAELPALGLAHGEVAKVDVRQDPGGTKRIIAVAIRDSSSVITWSYH